MERPYKGIWRKFHEQFAKARIAISFCRQVVGRINVNRITIKMKSMSKSFATKTVALVCIVAWLTSVSCAKDNPTPRFKAVAFDYFVIFDANSVIPEVEKIFPGKGAEFTRMWRSKQFEYGYLRSITARHEDFFKVTEDALVYTAEAMKLDLPAEARKKLLNAYLTLKPWPDAADALRKLRASGVRIITIANFSGKMLRANAEAAGMTELFDELLSTEVNSTYKPDPRAYALGMERLKLKKEEIVFAAFGGWDAYGAKTFGYPTYWVNRFNLPVEELGIKADETSNNLEGLLKYVLGQP
jgi:2-haloacid dehalogenase